MISNGPIARSAHHLGLEPDQIAALTWAFTQLLNWCESNHIIMKHEFGICWHAADMLIKYKQWPEPYPHVEGGRLTREHRYWEHNVTQRVCEVVEHAGASWPLSRTPWVRNQSPIDRNRDSGKWEGEQLFLRTELLKHLLLWLKDEVPQRKVETYLHY